MVVSKWEKFFKNLQKAVSGFLIFEPPVSSSICFLILIDADE